MPCYKNLQRRVAFLNLEVVREVQVADAADVVFFSICTRTKGCCLYSEFWNGCCVRREKHVRGPFSSLLILQRAALAIVR